MQSERRTFDPEMEDDMKRKKIMNEFIGSALDLPRNLAAISAASASVFCALTWVATAEAGSCGYAVPTFSSMHGKYGTIIEHTD
jgi:hypothetical protein